MSGKAKKAPVVVATGRKSIASFFVAPKPSKAPEAGTDGVVNAAPVPKPKPAAAVPAAGALRDLAIQSVWRSALNCALPNPAAPPPPKPAAKPKSPPAKPPAKRTPPKATKAAPSAPTARGAASPAGAADTPSADATVGRRLEVYWSDEKAWFPGTVASVHGRTGGVTVHYDDGDTEELQLGAETVRWLPPIKPGRSRAATRVLDSDDDGDGDAMATAPAAKAVGDNDDDDGSEFDGAAAGDDGGSSSGSDAPSDDDHGGGGAAAGKRKRVSTPVPKAAPPVKRTTPLAKKAAPPTAKVVGGASTTAVAKAKAVVKAKGKAAGDDNGGDDDGDRGGSNKENGGGGGSPGPGVGSAVTDAFKSQREAFDRRAKERFPFASPPLLRDGAKRLPSHPEYDAGTMHVPPSFYSGTGKAKVSPAQQQWWRFKAANADAVILFKCGKFYEMFEADAHVGADVLGLQYMKGDQPHAGFPEKAYAAHAERLARSGRRVVVVEQTETTEQQKQRKAAVLKREVVSVLTRGTLADGDMLESSPDAAYLAAIVDLPLTSGGDGPDPGVRVGVCAVDAGTGRFLLAQFEEPAGGDRPGLAALLADLRPVEMLLPRGGPGLSPATKQVMLAGAAPGCRLEHLPWLAEGATPAADGSSAPATMWPAAVTVAELESHGGLPAAVVSLVLAGPGGEAALVALGGCVSYLRKCLLADQLLPLRRFEIMPGTLGGDDAADVAVPDATAAPGFVDAWSTDGGWELASESSGGHMRLGAPALSALEVVENADGGAAGTLLAAVDGAATAAGRRLLRRWLLRPLVSPTAIRARQEAIAELRCGGRLASAAAEARSKLRRGPDLERSLARLAAQAGGGGRHGAGVVLYEDAGRRRLIDLVKALRGVADLETALSGIAAASPQSPLLRGLVTPSAGGLLPLLRPAVAALESAFDWDAAVATGRVVPKSSGQDEDYDAAAGEVTAADDALATFLRVQQRALGADKGGLVYATCNKDTHQLEVIEQLWGRVPASWSLQSSTKKVRRYTCGPLDSLREARATALEAKEAALAGILQRLQQKFAADAPRWLAAAAAAAHVDALASLASHADAAWADGHACIPQIVETGDPVLELRSLRHPCAHALVAGGVTGGVGRMFVPNDTVLGGTHPRLLLLTGANMGGKSTLLRQVCLAAILAQVGAVVPAISCRQSPADGVHVRMGARDDLAGGRSTFLVELQEAAAVVRGATHRSLVALDELGRGTSTADGAALAYAAAAHLASVVRCRALFSTHYHRVAEDLATKPGVAVGHMAAEVTPQPGGGPPTVTFLYTLQPGSCPRSYGVNVARLAGLPEQVLEIAATRAATAEAAAEAGRARVMAAGAGGLTTEEARRLDAVLGALRGDASPMDVDAEGAGGALIQAWNLAQQATRD